MSDKYGPTVLRKMGIHLHSFYFYSYFFRFSLNCSPICTLLIGFQSEIAFVLVTALSFPPECGLIPQKCGFAAVSLSISKGGNQACHEELIRVLGK